MGSVGIEFKVSSFLFGKGGAGTKRQTDTQKNSQANKGIPYHLSHVDLTTLEVVSVLISLP